ncbi:MULTISPECIES: LysR family transcriptional regulator [unclassified Aureimonas]|uniref:LysR family transcriptional regulator n=1 Tax=unclassified Aureimonas TaxID=2615206 RepID=UPI0009E7AEEC|nr:MULTISPECIES: LysR family transcriptional regulator [unclassified Aureimonas]
MELRQLRYFVTLAEAGSVSRAAAILGVTQPAISRQIRLLEESLAIALFYRTGRGMDLTEAGRLLMTHAPGVLSGLQRIESEIGDLRGVAEGQVVLGVPPTEGHFLIPPLVQRLRAQHPRIALKVIEAFSGHVTEWLLSGRLDIALFYKLGSTRQLSSDELLVEGLYLIGKGGLPEGSGPVGLAEIAPLDLILPSRSHGLRVLLEHAAEALDVRLRVGLEIDALLTIKALVETGAGMTILPYPAVERDVAAGRLTARPIRREDVSRTMMLGTSTQHPLSLASRTVTRELRLQVLDLVRTGRWPGATT